MNKKIILPIFFLSSLLLIQCNKNEGIEDLVSSSAELKFSFDSTNFITPFSLLTVNNISNTPDSTRIIEVVIDTIIERVDTTNLLEEELDFCEGVIVDTIEGVAFRTSGFYEDQYVCVDTVIDTSYVNDTTYNLFDELINNGSLLISNIKNISSDIDSTNQVNDGEYVIKITFDNDTSSDVFSITDKEIDFSTSTDVTAKVIIKDLGLTETITSGELIIDSLSSTYVDLTYTFNIDDDEVVGVYRGAVTKSINN